MVKGSRCCSDERDKEMGGEIKAELTPGSHAALGQYGFHNRVHIYVSESFCKGRGKQHHGIGIEGRGTCSSGFLTPWFWFSLFL